MVNDNSFLSVNEVLADVLVALDDQDTRKASLGFYKAQVRNAIDELGFDTVFIEDWINYAIPADCVVAFPAAAYRIKDIQVFTGDPDDETDSDTIDTVEIGAVQNVYWKKGARGAGFEKGYTASNHPSNYTDIYFTQNPSWGSIDIAYFFTYVNGNITLSDACSGYDYVRIRYDGVPTGKLEDTALIPPEVRNAVVLWAIERSASFMKLRYPELRTVQLDAAAQLDVSGLNGIWHNAKMRLKYLGKKIHKDMLEYNNRLRA